MIIIESLQYIIASAIGILLGYQMVLSFLALRGKKIQNFEAARNRKFAIVLPAHNEEKVIAKSLYSMSGLVYPKNMYDLIVIADNCTDSSAKIARNLGAIVLERSNDIDCGKGYALRWAFDQILKWKTNYDAIIVFDSDSLVSGNYLEVMNYYMEHGSKVIQSSDLVLPQPGAWSSEATRIGFLLYNYVKPMGRKVLGLNMGLRGNGMCFATDVLRKIPWQAWSLTEDVEYGLILQLEGVTIDFAPEAQVCAQMPTKAENAESQRRRWEIGRYPVIKKYAPKLLAAAFKKRSIKYLDSFLDLVTPPLVNTLLFVLLLCGLNVVLWLLGWMSANFIWLWATIAVFGLLHLFVGLAAAGADRQLLRSLFYIPVYVFWKIKVYVTALFNRNKKHRWIRTTRESSDIVSGQ